MVKNEKNFEIEVARVLASEGLEFEAEPSIGGLRPDFLVYGPNGKIIAIETKPWIINSKNFSRALEQAKHYQRATGADSAFVVVASTVQEDLSAGIVSV